MPSSNKRSGYVPNVTNFFTPFGSSKTLEDILDAPDPDFDVLYYKKDDLHRPEPPRLTVKALPGYRMRIQWGKTVLTECPLFSIPPEIRRCYHRRGALLRPVPFQVGEFTENGECPVQVAGNNLVLFWVKIIWENNETGGKIKHVEIIRRVDL